MCTLYRRWAYVVYFIPAPPWNIARTPQVAHPTLETTDVVHMSYNGG
jgi:hypothetical protein